jgi:sortase (surface protein transpeptidase)
LTDIELDLPVTKGAYDPISRTWTLDKTHVFVNTLTNPKGFVGERNKGDFTKTPLLYGHNAPGLLAKTMDVKPGMKMKIVTENGFVLEYKYIRSTIINPEDSWILDYKGGEDLMLMTCTGVTY